MIDFLLMVGGALFTMFISGIINYKKSAWIDLTDEEIQECLQGLPTQTIDVYARRIEAKLKEKNGY